jgi:2-dehydro-3-deoxygluconokinase
MVSVALPTFDDEAPLFGDRDPSETIRRWRAAGATEIVVKLGAEGCMLTDGLTISPTARLVPVDTTGAGDSFNAAYLAARRRALSNADAAAFANTLAGRVIMSRGAILPRSAMSDLVEALASRRGPVAR